MQTQYHEKDTPTPINVNVVVVSTSCRDPEAICEQSFTEELFIRIIALLPKRQQHCRSNEHLSRPNLSCSQCILSTSRFRHERLRNTQPCFCIPTKCRSCWFQPRRNWIYEQQQQHRHQYFVDNKNSLIARTRQKDSLPPPPNKP